MLSTKKRPYWMVSIASVLIWFIAPQSLRPDVKLPSIFGSHMVLQQEKPIHVWGWADKN